LNSPDTGSTGATGGSPLALGGPFAHATLRVLDSVTEAVRHAPGAVLVTGSHGGASVVPYALAAHARLVVFNDAGVGLEQAGIAALAALQQAGMPACTVGHDSARIGEAASTLATGVLSFANDAAATLGARPGRSLREWLLSGS
jgi:hypothetical protein